jgi:quercetin dioxygenase-like cupin family protein
MPDTKKNEPQLLRFSELKTYGEHHAGDIPIEAMERVAARRVYPIMAPTDYKGRSQQAPIKSGAGVILSIAECTPGNGPALHMHEDAVENFFCLNGRFEVTWGEGGKNSLILEPLDFVSIPIGIDRAFKNISEETARLFAIIQPVGDEQQDNVTFPASVAVDLSNEFGDETLDAFQKLGMNFRAS